MRYIKWLSVLEGSSSKVLFNSTLFNNEIKEQKTSLNNNNNNKNNVAQEHFKGNASMVNNEERSVQGSVHPFVHCPLLAKAYTLLSTP